VTVFTLLFAIPAAFVVSAFVVIVRELWTDVDFSTDNTRSASGVVRSRRAANVLAGRRRIARLLGAIAIAFAICWTPYHLLRSVTQYSSLESRVKIFNERKSLSVTQFILYA